MFENFKLVHLQILAYCIQWISSITPPFSTLIDGKTFYWFTLEKIAKDLWLTKEQVRSALYRLEYKDKRTSYSDTEPFVYAHIQHTKKMQNRLYLSFNREKIDTLFKIKNVRVQDIYSVLNLSSKIQNFVDTELDKENEMNEPLFECDAPVGDPHANEIVKEMLASNADIFSTRVGNTKTYRKCCQIVTDIYNGNFLNPHVYNLRYSLDNKNFNIDGWREKVSAVEGDWEAVKSLMLQSVDNYRLMFDKEYMPLSKAYLPNTLEKYLFDEYNTNYTSYFVFSLRKPEVTKKQLGEIKADKIYDSLPIKIKKAGNRLVDMMPTGTNQLKVWKNIYNMYTWARWASIVSDGVFFWIDAPENIVDKFADYCIKHKLIIGANTIDIKLSIDNNGPWQWFVQNGVLQNHISPKLMACADADDFYRFFPSKKKDLLDIERKFA